MGQAQAVTERCQASLICWNSGKFYKIMGMYRLALIGVDEASERCMLVSAEEDWGWGGGHETLGLVGLLTFIMELLLLGLTSSYPSDVTGRSLRKRSADCVFPSSIMTDTNNPVAPWL